MAKKSLKVWGAEQYGCNHSGHQWRQLAVQSASASVLFPSLPLHPLHIQKLGTGSLMADFTQEILQRSVENIEAVIRCVWGCKNRSLSTVSKAIKMCRLAWCYKQGKTRVTEGPVWANLATKEITGLNHNKSAKQEPNPH